MSQPCKVLQREGLIYQRLIQGAFTPEKKVEHICQRIGYRCELTLQVVSLRLYPCGEALLISPFHYLQSVFFLLPKDHCQRSTTPDTIHHTYIPSTINFLFYGWQYGNELGCFLSQTNKWPSGRSLILFMGLLKTACLAVLFGSLYTVFRKYQSVVDLPQSQSQFNQPILQSFIIFVGMCSVALFRPWMKEEVGTGKQALLPSDNKYLYIMPSLLDVFGTIVDTTGLFYTSVSISQMLKGSVLFFTYLITLFYLKRALSFKKHLYMLVILVALGVIGSANLAESSSKFESRPLLGNGLIILSQFLFSLMFIYQEKILRQYHVRVENAVFWQGIWGVAISGLALILFSVVDNPLNPQLMDSCLLICSNGKLLFGVLMTALCIAPFNYFGISLTKQESALQRCMICTSRMIVVWLISLLFEWERFHLPQLLGYALLTWGIYQFNHADSSQPQNVQQSQEQSRLRKQIDS